MFDQLNSYLLMPNIFFSFNNVNTIKLHRIYNNSNLLFNPILSSLQDDISTIHGNLIYGINLLKNFSC